MSLYYFDGIIVVEGKEDVSYLSSFIKSEYVTTNGYDIPSTTLQYLQQASEYRKVIIFVDSDEAGNTIRNKLEKLIDNPISLKVDIDKCHGKKHGVAECEKEEIIEVLHEYLSRTPINFENTISKTFLFDNKLIGPESSKNRELICRSLNLGFCNGKKFLERLNNLNISENGVLEILRKGLYGN